MELGLTEEKWLRTSLGLVERCDLSRLLGSSNARGELAALWAGPARMSETRRRKN